MRKVGLTCDNLLAADVVTADGQLVHTSVDENPELLWGLRGGGGNFGHRDVTRLLRLHPIGPMLLAGPIFFAGDRAEEVLRFLSRLGARAARRADDAGQPHHRSSPRRSCPQRPTASRSSRSSPSTPVTQSTAAHWFSPSGTSATRSPTSSTSCPTRRCRACSTTLWTRGRAQLHALRLHRPTLTDEAIAATRRPAPSGAPHRTSEIHFHHFGGAVTRGDRRNSAFGDRSAQFVLNVIARSPDAEGLDARPHWARGTVQALAPVSRAGAYVNFMGDAGDKRLRASYGDANYERLVALKRRYDPANLFHLNQNISPQ